ncbi:hypothetical protein FQN50_008505 [Emmonsiellopsis sp. PD_5]|nr:hypothetical protein FQN50_008505 [Emmonsiellopsis sp. PD_5]
MPGTAVFSDASGQQKQLGATAVALNKDLKASESQQASTGSTSTGQYMPRASWRYNTPSAGSIRSPESSKTA